MDEKVTTSLCMGIAISVAAKNADRLGDCGWSALWLCDRENKEIE